MELLCTGAFGLPYRINPQRYSRRGSRHGVTDSRLKAPKKCRHSHVVNCASFLHEKPAPAELLHKHGCDTFAAPAYMWHPIPCGSRWREMSVHLRSLAGPHTFFFANLLEGQRWSSCQQGQQCGAAGAAKFRDERWQKMRVVSRHCESQALQRLGCLTDQ